MSASEPIRVKLNGPTGDLATFELRGVNADGDNEGDLGAYGGNAYIYVDGKEYGSLWFHRPEPDGPIHVALGAFSPETENWERVGTLPGPIFPHPEPGERRIFSSHTDDDASRKHSDQVVTVLRRSRSLWARSHDLNHDWLWEVRAEDGDEFRAWTSELKAPDTTLHFDPRGEA